MASRVGIMATCVAVLESLSTPRRRPRRINSVIRSLSIDGYSSKDTREALKALEADGKVITFAFRNDYWAICKKGL